MPDWSYRTLFRPLLFRLPAYWARELTLMAMGGLSRFPGGSFVIRTLGHMEVHQELKCVLPGTDVSIQSPVGLSGGLDPRGTALTALSQFGFGFIEIGPVGLRRTECGFPVQRSEVDEEITYPDAYGNEGVDDLIRRLEGGLARRVGRPLVFRLAPDRGLTADEALEELRQLFEKLSPYAAGFFVELDDDRWLAALTEQHHEAERQTDSTERHHDARRQATRTVKHHATVEQTTHIVEQLQAIRQTAREAAPSRSLLLRIPADYDNAKLENLLSADALEAWDGFVIGDSIQSESGDVVGRGAKRRNLGKIRLIRTLCGDETAIIASGGIHEPLDAMELLDAGAGYFMLHSGLVFAGPGLPKRVNEAILHRRISRKAKPLTVSFWRNWGWMCLLGLAMIIGGLLAFLVAATNVVLPYDESFLHMDRSVLALANPNILNFMSHDRITLAGTMVSIGIMYWQLSYFGLREGIHWAKTALITSCVVGFGSFFLYLGYGYFDPLHALVAIVLFPLFLLSLRGMTDQPSRTPPNLRSDRSWLLAQWGQLMFITLGIALAVGGATIAWIGMHGVFVPTDITYICASPEALAKLNDRLIPLIAHDRAGFGGALLCDAIAILVTALWGIRQGERWLWWTLFAGGLPGFAAGFGVHLAIGYTDLIHLSPAIFALLLYVVGLILLYPYLMGTKNDKGGAVNE